MKIKITFITLLIFLAFCFSPAQAEDRVKIDPYEKVLAKFQNLSIKKKLPFIATLKIHSAIQLGDLALKKVDNKSKNDHILFTRLGIESNNNLIDFAKSANAEKFMSLFREENEMLEKRMAEDISPASFKKKQEILFKKTHLLLKSVTEQKGFKELITSSKKEISYFHNHHFLNALKRAVDHIKQ